MKLKNVLILSIFSLVLAFAVLSQMISSWLLQDELKYHLNRQLDLAVNFIQQRTSIVIRGVAVDVRTLESNEAFFDLFNYRKYSLSEEEQLKRAEIQSLFKKIVSLRPSYIKLDLIDSRDGQVVVQEFSNQSNFEKYHSRAVHPKVTYRDFSDHVEVSDPFFDPILNDNILKVKNSLIHNSVKVGEIVADLSLSRLLNELNRIEFLAEAKVIIKDSFGQVINRDEVQEIGAADRDYRHTIQSKTITLPNMNWTMKIVADSNEIDALQQTFNRRVLPILIVILICVLAFILLISKMVSKPAEDIVSLLKANRELDGNHNYAFQLKLKNSSYEFRDIAASLDDMFVRMKIYYQNSIRLKSFESKLNLAQQVAHDIRSPLAALNMITGLLTEIQETDRLLMRSAIHRINDIVNELLRQYKKEEKILSNELSLEKVTLISEVIDSIITEKRTQFRSLIGVSIESSSHHGNYGLFSRVNECELKRVISNLIDNSVEAIETEGQVRVEFSTVADQIVIAIIDNGKGIPRDLLTKLGQRGETHGKIDGLGLGLYHAKTSAQSWGGDLSIQSEVGKGTQVILKIPKSKEPAWFLPILQVEKDRILVILDDDVSIHQIWKRRFEELGETHQVSFNIEHFSTPQELMVWYGGVPNRSRYLFLVDQEFLKNKITGLEMIQDLGIAQNSILVTSHFEEQRVHSECERLGVKIIPKGLASSVPIEIL